MSEIQNALRGRAARDSRHPRERSTGTRSIFGGFRQPISVNVQGPEPSRLKLRARSRCSRRCATVPGVAEPQSSDEGDIPQLDVHVDRQQAWAAGLGIGSIASTLQPLFTGQRATHWEDPQGYSHDVVVVYPDSMRASAEDVATIPVLSNNIDPRDGTAGDDPARRRSPKCGPASGRSRSSAARSSGRSSISSGVLPGYAMGDVADDARKAIGRSIGLPPGYRTVFGGDVQNLDETKGYVLEAILLAVVFIYLILASLFGSFLQPLAIMLALPLSASSASRSRCCITKRNAQRDDDDRHHHADGARHEERHSAGRLRQPAARRRAMDRREALLHAGAHPPAPDHHDDGRR